MGRLEIAVGFVWTGWIYVEIDNVHARLRPGVAGPCMPRSVTQPNVTDLIEMKAFPSPTRGQAAAASASELIGQRDFLSLAVAEDDRTELARVSVVKTKNLFELCHGMGEQVIGLAWHGTARQVVASRIGVKIDSAQAGAVDARALGHRLINRIQMRAAGSLTRAR